MESKDRLYEFHYSRWGIKESQTKKFRSIKEAVDYAIHDLPKQGYTDIQPPKEIDYLSY